MEKTTIIGILAGFACIVISIMIGEGGSLMNFVDMPSVFIVFGGVIFATIASYPAKMLKALISVVKNAFRPKDIDLQKDIDMIISIANIARREGLLALEDAIAGLGNPFFKKGVMLVVDGADRELIKNVMEAEVYFVQDRHQKSQAILDSMADYAPAFGMIGTLIGLINMLQNLNDSAALGPGMSVALVTTFYGCLLANLVFKPLAKKLRTYTADEALEKELMLEGLLSIQDGENPRIIKDKLYSFIARQDIKDAEPVVERRAETEEIANE